MFLGINFPQSLNYLKTKIMYVFYFALSGVKSDRGGVHFIVSIRKVDDEIHYF